MDSLVITRASLKGTLHHISKSASLQKPAFDAFFFWKYCGESRIRTCEGKNQQIYSLSSLAA